jgi:hypothetical protein
MYDGTSIAASASQPAVSASRSERRSMSWSPPEPSRQVGCTGLRAGATCANDVVQMQSERWNPGPRPCLQVQDRKARFTSRTRLSGVLGVPQRRPLRVGPSRCCRRSTFDHPPERNCGTGALGAADQGSDTQIGCVGGSRPLSPPLRWQHDRHHPERAGCWANALAHRVGSLEDDPRCRSVWLVPGGEFAESAVKARPDIETPYELARRVRVIHGGARCPPL